MRVVNSGAKQPSILPPIARSPRLASQRKRVLGHLRAKRRTFLESLTILAGPEITIDNTIDQSACPETQFEFIAANEPIQETKMFDKDFMSGCDCANHCRHSDCPCVIDKFWYDDDPVQFAYDTNGLLQSRILHEKLTIYECNETCGCGPQCKNKVVMNGRKLRLVVFKTIAKGWGVRCPIPIPQGTFVSCYRGELIDSQTAEKRGRTYDEIGQTYLFDLDLFADDLEGQDLPMLTIDAYRKGDISRFFNHSCDPNLFSIAVSHGSAQQYEIAFFAGRHIKANEELCFDYDPTWQKKEAERDQGSLSQAPLGKCYCGTTRCRGWLFHK